MPKNPQEFADRLGAKIVGEVPDVGGDPCSEKGTARQRASPFREETQAGCLCYGCCGRAVTVIAVTGLWPWRSGA
jgi:hypothetical protein